MRIAIIGAGFCGLAVAWHLTNKGMTNLHLFDSLEIGQGTSGIAAGLLHSYAGAYARKSWRADDGLAATLQLLQVAETALQSSVIAGRGLIRLAISDEQKRDFSLAASCYPDDVHWLTADQCQQRLGYSLSHPQPGIFIDSGLTVDCKKYLQGLWMACAARGVQFQQQSIQSLAQLADFDWIIATTGASKLLSELSSLKITPVKGQVLELRWPEGLPPFAYPVSSQAYLLMHPEGHQCLAGATFERDYDKETPDLPSAITGIMPKLHAFLPELDASHVIGCRAGIRASAAGHRPLLLKISPRCWVLTGMGSKGLLYHALYAEELAAQICP